MKKLIRVSVLLLAVVIGILVLVKHNQNKEQKEFVMATDYHFQCASELRTAEGYAVIRSEAEPK